MRNGRLDLGLESIPGRRCWVKGSKATDRRVLQAEDVLLSRDILGVDEARRVCLVVIVKRRLSGSQVRLRRHDGVLADILQGLRRRGLDGAVRQVLVLLGEPQFFAVPPRRARPRLCLGTGYRLPCSLASLGVAPW